MSETEQTLLSEWPHSVKYSQDTKGVWRAEVKARGKTPDEANSNATKMLKDAQANLNILNQGRE